MVEAEVVAAAVAAILRVQEEDTIQELFLAAGTDSAAFESVDHPYLAGFPCWETERIDSVDVAAAADSPYTADFPWAAAAGTCLGHCSLTVAYYPFHVVAFPPYLAVVCFRAEEHPCTVAVVDWTI